MTEVAELEHEIVGSAARGGLVARLGAEVAKFGTVGAIAFVIDVGLFNLLMFGGHGWLSDKPLTAKGISVIVATTFAFFGNRQWTYADRARTGLGRETVLFFVTNGVALAISWVVLYISHYVLGLTSPLADNVSANIIGVGLGTLFRFVVYRSIVFPDADPGLDLPAPDPRSGARAG
ncbi:MAG: GtrA family protein [Candidatus Nanopelagicales bacterium]